MEYIHRDFSARPREKHTELGAFAILTDTDNTARNINQYFFQTTQLEVSKVTRVDSMAIVWSNTVQYTAQQVGESV